MPFPLLAAGIAAGSGLLSTGINAFTTAGMNRRTREWNEDMYALQRKDALSDWAMQNQYNSPLEQMARLRAAGLNPNLVYGHGATTEAGPMRSTDVKSWNPTPPQVNLESAAVDGLNAYYNVQTKDAQLENITAQNQVIEQQARLMGIKADEALFDLEFKSELRPTSKEYQEQRNRKLGIDMQISLDRNEREILKNAMSLKEAAERILNLRSQRATSAVQRDHIRQQIVNLRTDNTLDQMEAEARKKGYTFHDGIVQRNVAEYLNQGAGVLKGIGEKLTGKQWIAPFTKAWYERRKK